MKICNNDIGDYFYMIFLVPCMKMVANAPRDKVFYEIYKIGYKVKKINSVIITVGSKDAEFKAFYSPVRETMDRRID